MQIEKNNIINILIEKARGAMQKAYAPYSKFRVGVALLTRDGKIFTGCNVENASYSLTICAERIAIFKAVSEGYRDFDILLLLSDNGDFTPPCGACRQVMAEFGDFRVILVNKDNEFREYSVSDLLPVRFDFKI